MENMEIVFVCFAFSTFFGIKHSPKSALYAERANLLLYSTDVAGFANAYYQKM